MRARGRHTLIASLSIRRGTLETLFIIHRAKLLLPISPHPMDQQGSPCYPNFLSVTSRYHSKVNLVGALDAEKLTAAFLLYVLWIGFPTSPLCSGSGSDIKSYRDIPSHFDILSNIGVGIGINFDESALSSAQDCLHVLHLNVISFLEIVLDFWIEHKYYIAISIFCWKNIYLSIFYYKYLFFFLHLYFTN